MRPIQIWAPDTRRPGFAEEARREIADRLEVPAEAVDIRPAAALRDRVTVPLDVLDVLDSAPEEQFNALVRAAAYVAGTPISLLSLVDTNRQWFKANIGLPGMSWLFGSSKFTEQPALTYGRGKTTFDSLTTNLTETTGRLTQGTRERDLEALLLRDLGQAGEKVVIVVDQ